MIRKCAIGVAILSLLGGFSSFVCPPAEAASPWYYSVTGPEGSNEIPADKIGQILYFQFDATTADYVWGNVRIDFEPTLLECVSIEETPDPNGFWTAWVTTTADAAYGGGGSLYYYDSTGLGSDWAQYWVSQYGSLGAGPSGGYDNSLGIIRLYVMTGAGGYNGSVPLRIGFRIKQAGTAVFKTYANDWTAFGWPTAPLSSMSAVSSVQASSTGQGFSWNLADLPFRYTSVVNIAPLTCVQPPSGMIAWWPGDGNANDIIGSNHGTLMNEASLVEGKVGNAFSFDDTLQQYVKVPHNASLDIQEALTIDAWVMKKGICYPLNCFILAKGNQDFSANTQNGRYGLLIYNPAYGPTRDSRVALAFNTGIWQDVVYGTTKIQDNVWYHVAGTWDGTTAKIYVNGVLENSVPKTGTILTTQNQGSLTIGAEIFADGWIPQGEYFKGLIDEVELFNRALSVSEIQAIYTAGSAGKCKNRPPVANAGPDQTREMTSCAGAAAILNGSGSSDPDNDPLTYTWTANNSVIATGMNPTITLSYGTHTLTLTVDDGKGGTASDEVVIKVVDTTPPVLTVTVSPNSLWPPNHKYVTVTPSLTVNDACVATTTMKLVSVTSNEPDNGLGDGNTTNDIVVNSDGTISLRAERSGTGNGRVYTITYQATDIAGNATTASVTEMVPHNQ